MSLLNDFKLINAKSGKYFDLLENQLGHTIKASKTGDRERFGFYLYMLENICGAKDIPDLVEMITDTDFNKQIFNKSFEDYGIDAVYIDDAENTINLFNFKYREKFVPNKKQSINETILSTKFVNALNTGNVKPLKGKLKDYADEILRNLESKTIWKLYLYVVSNENVELDKNDHDLKTLEENYGLEVIPIGLNRIKEYMSIRPKPINASILLDPDAVMSFSENSISSSKSYILRLSISELIRITCDDESLRNDYNIKDLSQIANCTIDYSVLFDNVRGLVLKSKFNKNISKTLREEPTKFFMFNNGITIAATNVEADIVNVSKKVQISIKGLQVLNGGQTLRTVHDFNKEDKENINSLSDSEILVRVFKTTVDHVLTNKIAEYTNSQNSISNIDLKSLTSEQIQLEQYLDEFNIIYSRKSGDTGLSATKDYELKISMERFGQILFAIKGNPEKASNQKKQIFDKYYDDIFGAHSLKISDSPSQIKQYFEIKKQYDLMTYKSSDQKVFYILYLLNYTSGTLIPTIRKFERIVNSFEVDNPISEARKLIQVRFKEYLDKKFKISN